VAREVRLLQQLDEPRAIGDQVRQRDGVGVV
jgi:hypothetical protein